jgi:uroporphyrin-III C-methyltransferase/precorrin-2 dehydrogenase/sirohydrochlorin ferrochelatase
MPLFSAELASSLHSDATSVPAPERPPLLPIFLKLAGRRVLVVGGGPVAAAKLASLRDTGAEVVLVAPAIGAPARAEIARHPGAVTVVERAFEERDLEGAWLVVAAAPPEVNRQVAAAAEVRRLFVIAVDDPAAASAYGGGTLRRGGVTVAISTDGQAPALAGLLREGLDAVIPQDMDTWVAEARAQRHAWRAAHVPMTERRPLLLRALNRLYDDRQGDRDDREGDK